ncbi:hypothetical protein ERICIV_01722 [Paenibacillus larvae subsp. larvae]|uniref:Uncharacterized protein n=1 Tax=Paenibacillus larvae subsp. larvae TaxID=147375 RepID=A0A2L1UCK2_9BACL|nr:hypothetical protein [Paenibacillus larvae]AVF25879.1 hypothetical protein ERICIII_01701 [Paenibacillus larvae subsp. larvae]AVF30656.1 hypothetical protein ERICIV_01722 [Paenibacillus larvae subsp. larvae]MCY7522291.1 hypothetical protein [Paenibacillus larvae]MCY9502817.1 hypothetical protein [Paenibacillus larvae]MCY9681528.1 hypothetical protein [Paenibacillus larvae]
MKALLIPWAKLAGKYLTKGTIELEEQLKKSLVSAGTSKYRLPMDLQLFAGRGKFKFSNNNLPRDPGELIKSGWKDVTPEGMEKNTKSREYLDPETGMKVRFDPGKQGANGFEGKDHYHIVNPNSTGKGDYYLDANGKPVPKGSKASHILP